MPEQRSVISSVDHVDLGSIISWGRFAYAVLESPQEVTFKALAGLPVAAAGDYDVGLLFGDTSELRWRRLRSGLFRVVKIDDEGEKLEGAGELVSLTRLHDRSQMFLWGERQDWTNEWWEPRVPRRIVEYPEMPGQRLCVPVRWYRMEMDGEPARYLYRCCGVSGFVAGGAR